MDYVEIVYIKFSRNLIEIEYIFRLFIINFIFISNLRIFEVLFFFLYIFLFKDLFIRFKYLFFILSIVI